MGEVALHQVRDGGRVLTFRASVLGAATSKRGSALRWSELVVYRLESGEYLISKIGRSTVAHRPDCLRVNHRMISWRQAQLAEDDSEARVFRVPCPDCRPGLEPPALDTLLEVTRYRAILAPTAERAAQSLTGDRAALMVPQLVREILGQCSAADPNFAAYAEAESADPIDCVKATRTP